MFPNNNRKLTALIWMGIGSTFLTCIFSAILITYVFKINDKLPSY